MKDIRSVAYPIAIKLRRSRREAEQVGEGNIQNFSATKLDIQNVSDTTLDVPMDHSEASHDKPKSSFERISKWWKHMIEKFGWV